MRLRLTNPASVGLTVAAQRSTASLRLTEERDRGIQPEVRQLTGGLTGTLNVVAPGTDAIVRPSHPWASRSSAGWQTHPPGADPRAVTCNGGPGRA